MPARGFNLMIDLPVGGFNPLMYHPSRSAEINVSISNASYDLPVFFLGGLTLWSTIFFWYLFVGVFPWFCLLLFPVVHLLCVFIISLLFSFVFCFTFSCFWLYCFLCLSLWSKGRTNKEKRATTKGRNKYGQEKGRERKPPKTKEHFWKRPFVLFPSAVIWNSLSQKVPKTPKTKGFLGSSSFSQKSSTIQKTNQNKRTN